MKRILIPALTSTISNIKVFTAQNLLSIHWMAAVCEDLIYNWFWTVLNWMKGWCPWLIVSAVTSLWWYQTNSRWKKNDATVPWKSTGTVKYCRRILHLNSVLQQNEYLDMSRNYFQQTVCRADSWRYLHFSQQSVRLFASLSVTRLIINKHNAHLKNTNFKFQFFCYFSCVLLWRRCFGVVLCFFLFVCFFKLIWAFSG